MEAKKSCPCDSTRSGILTPPYEPFLGAAHPRKGENPLPCHKGLFFFGAGAVGTIGIHNLPWLCVWFAVFFRSDAAPLLLYRARSCTNFAFRSIRFVSYCLHFTYGTKLITMTLPSASGEILCDVKHAVQDLSAINGIF